MRLAAILVAAGILPAAADVPAFRFPVACTLGEDCFLQNLVDRDPGPGRADLTCGPASYDGHKGIDIRLATEAEIARGVAVLAAAPGTVRALRDGMEDRPARGPDGLAGRECGNGVVIDHGDGWTTQYCHLRRGSVAVRTGQRVAAGQPIGQIGLSGMTEFPHLHLTLRHRGTVIDPLDGRPMSAPCGGGLAPMIPLPAGWLPGPEIMLAGIAAAIPDAADLRAGPAAGVGGRDAPAMVLWVQAINLSAGDRIVLRMRDPDGRELFADDHAMPRDRAVQMRAVGRRRPAGGWQPGRHEGVIELRRGDRLIDSARVAVVVE
ncbi:MAG: peptidase M23 [Paracoccaceae bacterium]|nr:MAG: peptidase M23 [Paracoccaceae bacterium]